MRSMELGGNRVGHRLALLLAGIALLAPETQAQTGGTPQKEGRSQGRPEDSRITLRGAELPLSNVLGQLARSASLALVAEKDVKLEQPVQSLTLENMPFESALAVVLTPLGYSYAIDTGRNELRVFTYQTRTFKVTVPILVQSWDTSISNEGGASGSGGTTSAGGPGGQAAQGASGASGSGAGGLGAKVSLETRSDTKGLWDEVEKSLDRLVGKDGSHSISRVAGFATIRTTPANMSAVEAYFGALNDEMGRFVTVETKVLQVDFRRGRAAGINWNALATQLGNLGGFISGALPASGLLPQNTAVLNLTGRAGDAFVRALEEQGEVRIVAQPTLVLGNNLPAILEVGTVHSYVSQQTAIIAQGGTSLSTVQTASLSDGLILSILPRLLGDGEVALAVAIVKQDLLELRKETFSGGFVELPKSSRRAYSGVVRAKVGETLVIGGLLSDRDEDRHTGLPFLAGVPIVGILFGARDVVKTRSELVISISPRLVTPLPPKAGSP